jgi:hypothetical protein
MKSEIERGKRSKGSFIEESCDMKTISFESVENPIMTIICDNGEILRFEKNGDIFVHGNLSTNDSEVTDGFREFLKSQGYLS